MMSLAVSGARRSWICGVLGASVMAAGASAAFAQAQGPIAPIDPQKVEDQDVMTWDDYKPIPGTDWANPEKKPAVRGLKIALIAIDFPDQPFVITKPKGSDLFGNPQIDPIKREDVPQFYADFWHKPSKINHGQTINGYWMEQSRGKYGIDTIDAYGPYKMPHPLWYYGGNEHRQNDSTPDGTRAQGRMEPDCDELWRNEPGATNAAERNTVGRGGKYDQILRIYAGYDETGVWQEFGEMKFETREDIPSAWGNPNPDMPRWVPTRYVPWTSWAAGMQQWGLSSIRQGENSGTIMHELGHSFFSTGDNNNNPYAEPYRRVGAGPWDMMDRGSFNGPGGPHMRWVVPVLQGGAMPAGLMLRQKINFGFLSPDGQMMRRNRTGGRGAAATAPASQAAAPAQPAQALPAAVLFLSREGLAKSGLAVATVTARAVDPLPGEYAGIVVRFDGEPVSVTLPANAGGRGRLGAPPAAGPQTTQVQDRTPWEDPATHPLSPGIPNYNNYTLEVVQRIGYDSFCPDSGVLLAKNKDQEGSSGGPNGYNCFNWVIDAHPEDIHQIDFKRPKSGEAVYRTVADFRQLNDALFHAGTNSGSACEWEDGPNRLHFYIVETHKNEQGILSYTLAVRSLDGAGPHTRGVAMDAPAAKGADGAFAFTLKNTGTAADIDAKLHPQDSTKACGSDVYRLKATVDGQGWTAVLPNALAAVQDGQSQAVKAYAVAGAGASATATLTVTATSESDPSKTVTTAVKVMK